MKKLFLFFASIFLSLIINAQSISKEGEFIEFKQKSPNIDYLGFSGDHFLAYTLEKKDNFDFKFIKVNKKTLSVVNSKDILIEFKPYKFHLMLTDCSIDVFYKQNKIFILYSLLDTKGKTADFRIFLKILNENFEEISNEQIGLIHDTGFDNQGGYQIVFSPDDKTMLLVLKNLCEKKKALLGNYSVYENSELHWINLETGKKTYSKFLPLENADSRIKTTDYKIANNGNLAFIMTHHSIDNHFVSTGTFIGYNEFMKEHISVHEIKLNQKDSIFSNSLTQLKNEKAVYICKTNYRYLYKTIDLNKGSLETDNQFSLKKSDNGELEINIKEIIEKDDYNYFVCYRNLYHINNGNYWAPTVYKMNKKGEFVWARNLAKKTIEDAGYPHLYNHNLRDAKIIENNDKIQLIYLESDKNPPVMSDNIFNDNKQYFVIGNPLAYSNLVSYSISLDKGNVSKNILFQNTRELGIVPYYGYLIMDNGELLLNFSGPKKIQFATLKL